jgi:hypothetical protein
MMKKPQWQDIGSGVGLIAGLLTIASYLGIMNLPVSLVGKYELTSRTAPAYVVAAFVVVVVIIVYNVWRRK